MGKELERTSSRGSPGYALDQTANQGAQDRANPPPHPGVALQMLPAYIQSNLKERSAKDLKRVIEKWLDESVNSAETKMLDTEQIDPVLMRFVKNNYSPVINEEFTPESYKNLEPIEARKQLFSKDEPLYSVEDQKRFLKREFAIAAALEGMDEHSVIKFVKEFMDPNDVHSSGNGCPNGDTLPELDVNAIHDSAKNAIQERNPIMLSTMLEDFEMQIAEINATARQLNERIDAIPDTEEASEDPSVEPSSSEIAPKAKFKAWIHILDERRAALVQGTREITEFLAKEAAANGATTSGVKPDQ